MNKFLVQVLFAVISMGIAVQVGLAVSGSVPTDITIIIAVATGRIAQLIEREVTKAIYKADNS